MSRRKDYGDDDGRRIADMSAVEKPHLFSAASSRTAQKQDDPAEPAPKPEWQTGQPLTGKDRRAFIWGALGAALLIALAFIGGIGLVILLMTTLW